MGTHCPADVVMGLCTADCGKWEGTGRSGHSDGVAVGLGSHGLPAYRNGDTYPDLTCDIFTDIIYIINNSTV